MKLLYSALILFLLTNSASFATHILGGEIRATHISGQTYKISVLIYNDAAQAASIEAHHELSVCMGDKNVISVHRVSIDPLPASDGIVMSTYEGNYTFPMAGIFQISAELNNRSDAINFPHGSQSVFFPWTWINTLLPSSTPVLPPPSFQAGVRQVFSMDLKPTTHGDSVSYRFQKLSKPSPGTCGIRRIDPSYVYPNDVTSTGTFMLDQTAKKLIWTAPERIGRYVYAIIVSQWKDGIVISETYRESTVLVTDRSGPTVDIPDYKYAETSESPVTGMPSLESPEVSFAIEAYPNPVQDIVNVSVYSKNRSNLVLQLIDINGQVLREIRSKSPEIVLQEQFDLRNFASGMYLLKADNGKENVTKKILR